MRWRKASDIIKWTGFILVISTLVGAIITANPVILGIGIAVAMSIIIGLLGYAFYLRLRIVKTLGIKHFYYDPDHQMYKMIRSMLHSRPTVAVAEYQELWDGNIQYARLAKDISQIIIENLGLPLDTIFYPDDPFLLTTFDIDDGMDQVDAIMA